MQHGAAGQQVQVQAQAQVQVQGGRAPLRRYRSTAVLANCALRCGLSDGWGWRTATGATQEGILDTAAQRCTLVFAAQAPPPALTGYALKACRCRRIERAGSCAQEHTLLGGWGVSRGVPLPGLRCAPAHQDV